MARDREDEEVDCVLGSIAEQLEAEKPVLNEARRARIGIPEGDPDFVEVELNIERRTVFLFSDLCDCPAVGRGRFCRFLLSANVFGRMTGHGSIGMDDEGRVLLEHRLLIEDFEHHRAHRLLEEHVRLWRVWQRVLVEEPWMEEPPQREVKSAQPAGFDPMRMRA